MEGRAVCVYLCLALAASLGLALAITYLEVRRSEETARLEASFFVELERLRREIELLREELNNRTARMTEKINSLGSGAAEGGAEEDYYYDEYEDEEERRSRREVSPALLPYNLILRQGFKSQPNRTLPMEVKARIIVKAEEEKGSQAGYELAGETTDRPQRPNSLYSGGGAVHFTGDTSRVRHSPRSHCYDVNHRMCHVQGVFQDWSPTRWSEKVDSSFFMKSGHLTIRNPGIYYLYAQIFYADNHDVNGYRIYVNANPTFQCTITSLHEHSWIPGRLPYKKNSCFTGGLVELKAGDRIAIQEIDNVERYSVFEPYKSYFGLFKVSHAKR